MTVNNVYIFVADALRDDYLPSAVSDVGRYVPTIAGGTTSPEGFASIVSGLYPTQHCTHAFTHRLDPAFNFLNFMLGYDTRFFQINETELSAVLGIEQETENPVDNMEEPFVVLERDMTTHAPYGYPNDEDVDLSSQEYFGGKNVDWEHIRDDYETASERVGERFLQRLNELEAAGFLEDTLVIFTADHGELLGEYSEMSHGEPLVPELAKVPTVIRHPDSDPPPKVKAELMGHVDLLPTITDVLDVPEPWTSPGQSVYVDEGVPCRICERKSKPHTLNDFSFQNFYNYSVRSIWGTDGGYAFNDTSLPGLGIHTFRQTPLFNPLRGRDALQAFEALYHHVTRTRRFGSPEFTVDEAREYLREMDEFSVQLSRTTEEISEEAREELEHLGYL